MNMLKNKSNNEAPLFFLFTCVKDGRQYINKLFDSLLSQTKINFVHYIYEDGSDEPLDEIVEQYNEEVSKLSTPYKVIYEKNPVNIGLNMATKHCIDMCFCPYFIWIDCDNWVDMNFFNELEQYILCHKNIPLVRTLCLQSNQVINDIKKNYTFKCRHDNKQLTHFLYGTFFYGFFAVKLECYLKLNQSNYFFDKRDYFNDDQVLSLFLFNNKKISICDSAIGYFLLHDNNESVLYRARSIEDECVNWRMTFNKFTSLSNNMINGFYLLINSFNKMVECYYKFDLYSTKFYLLDILKIRKKYKISSRLSFGYGSTFTWMLRLFYLRLRIIKLGYKK